MVAPVCLCPRIPRLETWEAPHRPAMAPVILQTAGEVYDAIEGSAVMPLLGTVRVDGEDFPALMVAGDSEPVPGLDGASGVVMIVSRDRATRVEPTLNDSYAVQSFMVRAMQFGPPPHALEAVGDALSALFPMARVSPIGGPAALAGHGQLVVTLAGPVIASEVPWAPAYRNPNGDTIFDGGEA